jgi:hypothetical protein
MREPCSGVVARDECSNNTNAEQPFGSSAILGSFVASGRYRRSVAEEARTRGFATPAFAGWAFVEV